MGKDSTTLVHLAKKAFLGGVPIPVIHIDTTFKFKQIYEFRDHYAREWNLNLIIVRNEAALQNQVSPDKGRFNCCTALKTEALKQAIGKYGFKALFLAIRRDEHAIRAKERYFSPRTSDFIWDYKKQPAELWDMYKTGLHGGEHLRAGGHRIRYRVAGTGFNQYPPHRGQHRRCSKDKIGRVKYQSLLLTPI